MDASPIEQLLAAIDRLDLEATMALMGSAPGFLTAEGHLAEGPEAVREVLSELLATLRSTSHRISSQWQVEDLWIAEVEADYELQDRLQINGLRRAFFVQMEAGVIASMRVYGAHEHPLTEHGPGEKGLRVGERWIPPL